MSKKSWILLAIQFLTLGYLIGTSIFSKNVFILVFQCLGIGIAIWGITVGGISGFNMQPEVKSETLFTKGPFALIRNPMYLGILLTVIPAVIVYPSILRGIALILLTGVLLLKIYAEEVFLKKKFKKDYEHYILKTYRLIPWIY